MKMKAVIGLSLIVLCAALSAAAQCPKVAGSGPDQVKAGAPATFTVNVSGGDPSVTPTFNWTVSAGTIESGQGTSVITVDTKEAVGLPITATADVGGFSRECSTVHSTTAFVERAAEARKFDEFSSAIKPEDLNARLDNFVIELNNDPTVQGYLIAYGGRRSKRGAAAASMAKAKAYITKTRKLNASRLAMVDGGYRDEPSFELYLVPSGAPAPFASPTVDPSEVQAPKPAAKKRTTRKKA
jgi:hypothetical protein